nr:MAG TPA: hypothetical protein [Caudoviricetes sp.]
MESPISNTLVSVLINILHSPFPAFWPVRYLYCDYSVHHLCTQSKRKNTQIFIIFLCKNKNSRTQKRARLLLGIECIRQFLICTAAQLVKSIYADMEFCRRLYAGAAKNVHVNYTGFLVFRQPYSADRFCGAAGCHSGQLFADPFVLIYHFPRCAVEVRMFMHGREAGVAMSSAPSRCLPLPDIPLKSGILQPSEHLLRVGADGKRTHLHPVELIGGGGRLGLLLLLEGHAEVVANTPGDGLADVNRVLHDPLGGGGVVVELALDIGRGGAGHPHLVQGGIHPDILAGAGGHRGQPIKNSLAGFHALTAAVKAEHAGAANRAVKGVGVDGHMEVCAEGVGFRALILHGGHMPYLHGHAAALQGGAAGVGNLAALDGLGGVPVGIAVVGLIAGGQIYFSHFRFPPCCRWP